jgi:hypothetical protein
LRFHQVEAMRLIALFTALLLGSSCARSTVVMPPPQNIAVRGFVLHAERDWPGTAEQQAQTVDTLDWLASAVQSLATTKGLSIENLAGRLQEFRASIKELAAGKPDQLQQTSVLRRTFVAGAALIEDVAAAAGLDLAQDAGMSAVRRAAESLDPERLPRQQADAIERYFRQASAALQRVDRGARAAASGPGQTAPRALE